MDVIRYRFIRTILLSTILAMLCGPGTVLAVPPGDVKILSGQADKYRPILQFRPADYLVEVRAFVAGRMGWEPAGSPQNTAQPGNRWQMDWLGRLQLKFSSGANWIPYLLSVVVAGDVHSGTYSLFNDSTQSTLESDTTFLPRKAYLRLSYKNILGLKAGITTTHWGLGLLTNSGEQRWDPTHTLFADPRGGDRVLRAMLYTGPHGNHALTGALAYDFVLSDELMGTDASLQHVSAAFVYGLFKDLSLGVIASYRHLLEPSVYTTHLWVADLYGKLRMELSPGLTLDARIEALVAAGNSDYEDAGREDASILHYAVALRVRLLKPSWGGGLDVLVMAGDGSPDDSPLTAFNPDPNFSMGFLYFANRSVSGLREHGSTVARNTPGGSADAQPMVTAFQPFVWVRPVPGLHIYAAGLFLLAGESPAHAGDEGPYLGSEVDLGIRFRGMLHGTELTVGLEGGVFFPGPASPSLGANEMVFGSRLLLEYRL